MQSAEAPRLGGCHVVDAPSAARHARACALAAAGQQRLDARKRRLEGAAEPDGRQCAHKDGVQGGQTSALRALVPRSPAPIRHGNAQSKRTQLRTAYSTHTGPAWGLPYAALCPKIRTYSPNSPNLALCSQVRLSWPDLYRSQT